MMHRRAVEALNRRVAHVIADHLPKQIGFALILFDFGEKGSLTFASNGERPDMVRCLRELLAHIEKEQN
jgi:hypothetical protein